MKERGKKKKKRIDDRAARMELSDHFVPEETQDEMALEEQIRSQMSGVGAQLKRDDPDELDEVYEQLRMDVSDEASEDDYEDESESEELLRRMPWLKYTAPEVLERASNRSYQYKGRRGGRGRVSEEDISGINPYAGEAFKEAVDELREKIMEAKESAEGEVKKRSRGKVYVPPMRAPEEPVVTFRPEPKPERMPPFYDERVKAPEEPAPVQEENAGSEEISFPESPVSAVQTPPPPERESGVPVMQTPPPAPVAPPPAPPTPPTPPAPPTAQTATLPPVRRPAPQAPPAGPVPFTSSALFRTPEGLPAGDMRSPEGLPATDTQAAAQIDPVIKEDVRTFKQGIIDLDDDADTVERMKEKLENERFEAEEALAEEVIGSDGAEDAFDGADPVTNYAPESKDNRKKTKRTLSAMERLKALAQTDEVEDESVKGRRPKMTALDRLEQMEALDRQGIPYAAQHRVGEAGFQGMQMQQMQQMRQMRPMMPMAQPMNPQMMGQPMNSGMMGGPMMGQPMMGQPMNPQMMGQPMSPAMMGGPMMGQPMMGGAMNPAMMGQTMPLPQLPPMPPFTQGMPQNAPNPQGQPVQNPQQGAGFDYNVSQGGGFDF